LIRCIGTLLYIGPDKWPIFGRFLNVNNISIKTSRAARNKYLQYGDVRRRRYRVTSLRFPFSFIDVSFFRISIVWKRIGVWRSRHPNCNRRLPLQVQCTPFHY
jgi:hypothetical protein